MTSSGVCVYSPYPTGGMPRYVAELLDAVDAAPGDEPRVEWVSSTDLDPRFRSDRYPVHPVLPAMRAREEFGSGAEWALSRALHYVRREWHFLAWLRTRPDLVAVHFQELPPAIAHLLVRRLKKRGKAVFVTVHNVRPHSYPSFLPRTLVDRSLRQVYARSDCLFVHSPGLAAELERFTGRDARAADAPRVRVVHHGVWTVGGGGGVDDEVLARRLREKRLLCFGAIRRNKGLHLLLEAAARGQLAGFRITVAGEPLELDYLEETVLPLADRARRAGVPVEVRAAFVPDEEIGPVFAQHSALVLPYTEEFVAQSGAAFMGLAYGLPVVATPSGGLGELMAGHRIGVTAPEPTAGAVAESVRRLFSATGRDVTELVHGMRSAIDELSWSGMATATLEEYRRAVPASPFAATVHVPPGETTCST